MNYETLMYLHLGTVLPATVIGLLLFSSKKGTKLHKQFGKVYMLLMLITAVISLFMPARIGSQLFGHFGYIHLFCILVLYAVPTAYYRARTGNIKAHKRAMVLLYLGAIGIAGFFAVMPGRYLHELIF